MGTALLEFHDWFNTFDLWWKKTWFNFSPQLAQGQDCNFRRFAMLEFSTTEMAEDVQRLTDGRALGGTRMRVSFCAPGPPGRSMLAALIAAQTMVDPHTSLFVENLLKLSLNLHV